MFKTTDLFQLDVQVDVDHRPGGEAKLDGHTVYDCTEDKCWSQYCSHGTCAS